VDTERAFLTLHRDDACSFWLDSALRDDTGRFSFLGAPGGPRAEVLRYRRGRGEVAVHGPEGVRTEPGGVFDVLARRTAARPPPPPPGLPFDFTGGYVGFFGYELKADCGAAAAHRADTPDAVWLRIDRFLAVDHAEGRTYLLARAPAGGERGSEEWIARTRRALDAPSPTDDSWPVREADPRPWLLTTPEDYRAAVKECLGHLAAGESYELCLTTQARLPAPDDDLTCFRRLRRASPAPYAALLRDGELAVLSASPERFLRIDGQGWAESRPIKGTAPRGADPEQDAALAAALREGAKTRAENLMIVDLLRNDLGRVCIPGSVSVPHFMYTRSYATVHQLISTVRGRLRGQVSPVRAIQACFPGGSMTGAPKLRTMELLDALEPRARGVYSGALGSVGYEGAVDLSIVIRTAVRWGAQWHIGAGGAVVLESDPDEEYEEMVLKAAVPMRGLG
jgi:para-aminobenzoate synthetase